MIFSDGHSSQVSLETIGFCMERGIELMCLPPQSTHRLNPLDTNFNALLNRMWFDQLRTLLSASEKVVLTKNEFFHTVWQEKRQKLSLIFGGFNRCGLYPLSKPTTAADFNACEAFENHPSPSDVLANDTSIPSTSMVIVSNNRALRVTTPSPAH